MWNLVKAHLALCVLFFWPFFEKDAFWKPKELVFIALGWMIVLWALVGRNGLEFKNRYLAAIGVYITALFSWYFLASFMSEGSIIQFWTLMPSLNVLLAILLVVSLVRCTISSDEWLSLTRWICLVGSLVAGYGLLQVFGFDNMTYRLMHTNRIFTTFGNSFLTAEFMSIVAPFFLVFPQKHYKLGLALVIFIVIMCSSLGASLALIAALVMFFLLKKQWKYALSVIGLVAFVVWWRSPVHSIQWFDPLRWALWGEILTNIKQAAIFGFGLGSFSMHDWSASISSSRTHAAHNDYLQFWFEGGLVLLVLMFLYFKDLLWRVIRCEGSNLVYAYLASLTAFSVNMMFGFPCRIAGLSIIAIITIAFLEAYTYERI